MDGLVCTPQVQLDQRQARAVDDGAIRPVRKILPAENLLEDIGVCGSSLWLSLVADVRSSDDVTTFEDAHWFEDPTLQEKVRVPKPKGKKKAGGGGGGGGGGGSWATVGNTKKKGGGGGAKQAGRKGGNAFAGLSFDD